MARILSSLIYMFHPSHRNCTDVTSRYWFRRT